MKWQLITTVVLVLGINTQGVAGQGACNICQTWVGFHEVVYAPDVIFGTDDATHDFYPLTCEVMQGMGAHVPDQLCYGLNEASRAALLDIESLSPQQVLELVAANSDALLYDAARGVVQARSCSGPEIVAQFDLDRDQRLALAAWAFEASLQ